ncbi:hypothetical protein [Saccharibacillus brassicae]|uniref:Uncharacterized protein n=1 Tax=Saccharibacillus brassicae TaxID=2583377 RepID=A0A4Y6USD9_SACBS|nr:hypothetical protein [Saccharibacillus brassicae]QDH19558.1 hypothetical protein FFV09_01010 [Saccharibacillus brassicae]
MILFSDAQKIIDQQIPASVRAQMSTVVRQGYILASETMKNAIMLEWELGRQYEGVLRNLAIAFLLHQKSKAEQLPFETSIESTKNKSYKYIVLSTAQTKLTCSQVSNKHAIARPAYFRDKLQTINNQASAYFSDIDGLEPPEQAEQHYLLLTYSKGGNMPSFINIGFPHLWHERIDLLSEIHVVGQPTIEEEKEEVIKGDNLINFRQFAEEVEGSGGG